MAGNAATPLSSQDPLCLAVSQPRALQIFRHTLLCSWDIPLNSASGWVSRCVLTGKDWNSILLSRETEAEPSLTGWLAFAQMTPVCRLSPHADKQL